MSLQVVIAVEALRTLIALERPVVMRKLRSTKHATLVLLTVKHSVHVLSYGCATVEWGIVHAGLGASHHAHLVAEWLIWSRRCKGLVLAVVRGG